MQFYVVFFFCLIFTDFASSVQVSFDKPDSGFFFKHSSIQPQQQQLLNNPISDLKNSPTSKENKDSVLSFNRFTVAQANHPVSIRASYGPFSTKQTVPARYIVPEDSDNFGYQSKVNNIYICHANEKKKQNNRMMRHLQRVPFYFIA